MAARRSGFFRGNRSVSTRRRTAWGLGPGGTGATAISSSTSTFLGAVAVPIVDGITVVRIRGSLLLTLITATGALDGFRGAFGIGVASLAAVTAGINSVPTPITEQESDNWLYHTYFQVIANISAEADFNQATVVRIAVDSKAMRKFPTELALYAAIDTVESGAAVMDASFDSRVLAKLP